MTARLSVHPDGSFRLLSGSEEHWVSVESGPGGWARIVERRPGFLAETSTSMASTCLGALVTRLRLEDGELTRATETRYGPSAATARRSAALTWSARSGGATATARRPRRPSPATSACCAASIGRART
jgi:hypothetical protein